MQQGMKKGLAAVLSVVLTASLLLNCFSIGVFAQDDSSALEEQIVAQLQQEGVPADSTGESAETEPENTPVVSAAPTQEPVATAEPQITATPEPTVVPEATATPEPTAAPEATATPEPTATPEATATPEPTATPEATAPLCRIGCRVR